MPVTINYEVAVPDAESGMPALDTEELAVIFGYRSRRGVLRAVRMGTFPIPTFVHRGRRFAHIDHVKAFFEVKKQEAEEEFEWE